MNRQPGFLSNLSLRSFLRGDVFRDHQDRYLAEVGAGVGGLVLEVGAEPGYGLARFFPDADRYLLSNIGRPSGARGAGVAACLDVTALALAAGSVPTAVCVSVLEHVDDLDAAVGELARVVSPGGRLVVTVPFLYPVHDTHDVRRLTPEAWSSLLTGAGFEIESLDRLGGKLATLAMLLQRPRGSWRRRYLPQKLLGAVLVALLGRFDQPDDAPLGIGLVARRR